MKHFLSGFSDEDAEVILKHCREVLTPDGKILLLQVRSSDPCRGTNRCLAAWRSAQLPSSAFAEHQAF